MSYPKRCRSSSPSTSKRHSASDQEDQSGCEYEVFLSFCGNDTRKNLTDFLYQSLKNAGIHTFRDDDGLQEGENIGKILEAIEHSKISIPIFSTNYASREWCMRELAKMAKCMKTRKQKILPIFYDVKPSVVREQSGCFEEALLNHEKEFGKETIQKWKEALREVSLLKGWVSNERFDGHQGKLVHDVVSTIWKMLKKDKLVVPDHNIVGIEDMERRVMELLDVDADDTRMVVIYGKLAFERTILSKIIYNKISDRFKHCSFLANIREKTQMHGLESLQKQLIISILEGNCPDKIHSIDDGINVISQRFRTKKVLILLDDMDKKEHLDAITKKREWFGLGSRIIVTTSNEEIQDIPEIYGFFEVISPQQSPRQLLPTEMKNPKVNINVFCILDSLRKNEVSKIGIYGLGGVGKTTLAMKVHDHLTKWWSFFRGVYWITVSQNYNIYSLQAKVAREAKVDLSGEDDPLLRRAKLSEALHKIGNFVLFLDDVWDYFSLEELGIFDTMDRCKVILTSRSLKICQRMDCNHYFKVNPLPELEAWNLFMEKLGNKMKLCSEITQIARSITKVCAGLPLAIITMASSMKGVDDIREWRDCLRMLKEPKEGPEDMELEVYSVLKFSYDRLNDTQAQQCLLYCAVYPEDYVISTEALIDLFILVGLIRDGSREAEFDRGHAILNKLENVCLLEKVGKYKDTVRMHDLIRDMALWISKFTFMVKSGQSLREQPDVEDWSCDLEVVCLMENEIKEISISPKCPRLSTLLISRNKFHEGIQSCFFEYSSGLKVLDLSYCQYLKQLPDSVANLFSLIALLLRDCRNLVTVPSLAKLLSLKRLDLRGTAIKKVPDGMENLINLKYLDLWRSWELENRPSGILQELSNIRYFWIDWPEGDVEVLKKGELGCLQKLEIFKVRFRGWEEYIAFAKSMVKPNRYVCCRGDRTYTDASFPRHHKYVQLIGGGEDSRTLPFLLPEDVQEVTLDKIKWKRLDKVFQRNDVANLEYCLTFSHLKGLGIGSCHHMERLFRVSFLSNLPNLEMLIVWSCDALQEIIEEEEEMRLKAAGKDEYTISLPKLRHLKLTRLFSLNKISRRMLACDSLEKLEISDCPKLERIPLSLKSINGRLSPPSSLKHIEIEGLSIHDAKGRWESLKWDIPDAKMALQPFVTLHGLHEIINFPTCGSLNISCR